jgi:hypothetical protein
MASHFTDRAAMAPQNYNELLDHLMLGQTWYNMQAGAYQ